MASNQTANVGDQEEEEEEFELILNLLTSAASLPIVVVSLK